MRKGGFPELAHLPWPRSGSPQATTTAWCGTLSPQLVRKQQTPKRRVYDRPARKSAATYEPDPLKLHTSCQLHGGTDYTCQWIPTVFKEGVTLEALVCPLNRRDRVYEFLWVASSALSPKTAFYTRPIVTDLNDAFVRLIRSLGGRTRL